jgi:hypothetical protein
MHPFNLQHIASWKPGLASKRIATARRRRSVDLRRDPRWKPGLASKRIATPVGTGSGLPTQYLTKLETRTRFKEDCDTSASGCRMLREPPRVLQRWKPGLASKRIATWEQPSHLSPGKNIRWKPGLASKRIATSLTSHEAKPTSSTRNRQYCMKDGWKPGLASKRIATGHPRRIPTAGVVRSVGNQDSLQRGLRLIVTATVAAIITSPPLLETRTRFKEDCDYSGVQVSEPFGLRQLETRTRFKEDCDESQPQTSNRDECC